MATGDYFLKIDGVEGESLDDTHSKQIEIASFSWGASNAASGATGAGSGTSKASHMDISFTKFVDNASPNLWINCVSGKHHATATFYCRKAGEKPQEYLTITFNEAFLSSYHLSGSEGSGLPMESFSLNYSKVKFEYKPQKADGTLGAANPKSHDLKTNKSA